MSIREEHQSHNIPASEPSTYWKWWVPLVFKWSGISNRNMVKVDLSLQPRRATWSRWSTWRMRCIVSNEHGVATRAFGSSDSLQPKTTDFANALKSVFWSRRSGDENTLLMIAYGSTRFLFLSSLGTVLVALCDLVTGSLYKNCPKRPCRSTWL